MNKFELHILRIYIYVSKQLSKQIDFCYWKYLLKNSLTNNFQTLFHGWGLLEIEKRWNEQEMKLSSTTLNQNKIKCGT